MEHCGYCLHYRFEETEYGFREWCALDEKNIRCAYVSPACDSYEPDQEYIEFMKGVTDDNRTN